MKLTLPNAERRTPICKKPAASAAFIRRSERGIALIITLILLSVTLVMAVAFLAISNRERASVTTTTDTANSRFATDAALSSAEAQIVANALAGGFNAAETPVANPYNFGLLVSTNYFNVNGFNPKDTTNDPVNVNYYYTSDNTAYNQQDFLQNLANLYYLPRVPLYVPQNGTNDFRFYLDLNRNGQFEDSGWVPVVTLNAQGKPQTNTINGNTEFTFAMGDPQWIGLLEHPGQPYGPNNKFIARFAFIAVPIGSSLDLNSIHNQTQNQPLDITEDGYFRNQGVGTWEINLAAFLSDLNTNQWAPLTGPGVYNYERPFNVTFPNSGYAFADAFSLVDYRYSTIYNSLASASNLFSPNSLNFTNYFAIGNVDGYSDLPLQTNFDTNYNYSIVKQNVAASWAGADNTNHFFDLPSDLFDPAKTLDGVSALAISGGNDFPARLLNAGTNSNATYDRYTFYRMLSQLSTDSSPETGPGNTALMNLNYDNIDYTNNSASQTNFMSWTPIAFFTNAADRMLKMYTAQWMTAYTNVVTPTSTNIYPILNTNYVVAFNMTNIFGITNIPVLVSNRLVYTPAVNRVLQLAANLYDATTTNYYPSVFRPLFLVTNQNGFYNVFITGYTNIAYVTGTNDPQLDPPVDLASILLPTPDPAILLAGPNLATNIYGIPWIIGAKKGFPSFNEFVGENMVGMTRRLQFVRDVTGATVNKTIPIQQTNQMYMVSVNTSGGLDFWNSYTNRLNDIVTVNYRVVTFLSLTNSDASVAGDAGGQVPSQPTTLGYFSSGSTSFSAWPSSAPWIGGQPNTNSFYVPLNFIAFINLSNSVYRTPNAGMTPGAMPPGYPYGPPALVSTNYFDNGAPITAVFENNRPVGQPFYSVPQWGLLSTNAMQVYILDRDSGGTNHVIDYVHMEQSGSQNLNSEIFSDDTSGVWNTNINPKYAIPWGIDNQILISEGLVNVQSEDGNWQADPEAATYSSSIPVQQADFQAFFHPYGSVVYFNGVQGSNFEATAQAPYAPTRYAVGYTALEANDPLVHYLASDLSLSFQTNIQNVYNNDITNVPPPAAQPFTIGQLNYNFQPWGGNPYNRLNSNPQTWAQTEPNAYDLSERDPMTVGPDNWDFPTNKLPTIGWIGRVHRGTPWQTVYMKSPDVLKEAFTVGNTPYVGQNIWARWTGDTTFLPIGQSGEFFDAVNSSPVWDRMLFDLFTTGINDNATRGQLSVNQSADQYDPVANPTAGLAGWSAVLSGMVVPPPMGSTNNYSVINPAGALGTNSALGNLVMNINSNRNVFVNFDGLLGSFEHKGDILSTPALTYQSPWLNLTQSNNADSFNNDEMYEWLPQQMMSLVRNTGAPRYVIYAYGQTLKPAPNGIYTGSATLANGQSAFGMITNYQVTAESATRAVIRIDNLTDTYGHPLTNAQPHAVIESINVLPPD
ncbi:MAG TPA: hypothetical protein VGI03_07725 [Verrucomicrobiae bacterium]|jgi:hypothetical protein